MPNFFAICLRLFQSLRVTRPLALVLYEKLLPGTQLVNRLQDLGYRVLTVSDAASLVNTAEQEKPMVVFADLFATRSKAIDAISSLRKNSPTSHLPVVAFAADPDEKTQVRVREAGATLVASDAAVLNHLEQFLEQALQLD